MALFAKQSSGEPVARGRALDSIPALNGGVELIEQDDGRILITVQLQRNRHGWLDRFRPAVETRRIRLDELGSFIVREIDGERTVREIVRAFRDRFRTAARESELSTADFLKSLAKRQVISIGVP